MSIKTWQERTAERGVGSCEARDEELIELRAALQERDAEITNLHTTMMAAAVEISEHWDAHCDAEGYGPCNLVRRLENGFPAQYGYDAKTVVRMDAQIEAQLKVLEQALKYIRKTAVFIPHEYDHEGLEATTAIQEVLA